MKRLISGILCSALVATCFCGCGKSAKEENSKETFYLLKEVVQKGEYGVLYRGTYEYDKNGLVISETVDNVGSEQVWDEYRQCYVSVIDGVADYTYTYEYDKKGNLTLYKSPYEHYVYEYTYDAKGRVTEACLINNPDSNFQSRSDQYTKYNTDGTVEVFVKVTREGTGDRLDRLGCKWKLEDNRMQWLEYYQTGGTQYNTYEYDGKGNLTNSYATYDSEMQRTEATCTFDSKGRVISEQRGFSAVKTVAYQYSGDKLSSINGEDVRYSEIDNGELRVTYKDFELTYEEVELSQDQIELARYRWNHLCRDDWHQDFCRYIPWVHDPASAANTELLLPRVIGG